MLAAFTTHPRAGVVGNVQLDARTGQLNHAGIVFQQGGHPIHFRDLPAAAPGAVICSKCRP